MPVDKLALVGARRDVVATFPDGKEFAVQRFALGGARLYDKWLLNPNDDALLIELLQLAVPDATEADLNTLSVEEDIPRILAAALGKTRQLEAALKNVGSDDGSGALASPTAPSSRTTMTSTS